LPAVFDDWQGADRTAAIAQIEADLTAGLKAQNEKIGQQI